MENSTPQEPLINFVDPDTQEIGSLPQSQAQDALAQGYVQATPEETQKFINQQKYSTPGQMAKTAAEGFGEGLAGPLFTGAEKALGVKGEDIRGRREESPTLHGTTQAAGLVTGMMAGVGEGALLEAAGTGASKLAGLGMEGASLSSKIGSKLVSGAVENSLFQAGDEATRAIAEDPNQSADTAITDIGLMGLMGGGISAGFGAVSPLWKATNGGKLSQTLQSIRDRIGGEVVPDAVHDAIQASGINVAPEIKAAISGDLSNQKMFQALAQSDTGSGKALQETITKVRQDIPNNIISAIGKTPEQIDALATMSENEAGKKVQDSLASEFKSKIDPISEQYEKLSNKFKDVKLPQDKINYLYDENPYLKEDQRWVRPTTAPGSTSKIAEELSILAQEKGYFQSPSSPEMKMINRIIKEVPAIETLEGLRKYQSLIGGNIANDGLWDLGKGVRTIFGDAEEAILRKAYRERAPQLLEQFDNARASYKEFRNLMGDMNDRLHVGKHGGPDTFLYALNKMSPEDVIRRLSGKGDADLIKILSEKFPQTFNQLKEHQLNQILKTATKRTAPGEAINPVTFFKTIDGLSPEMKASLIPQEAMSKLEGTKVLLESMNAIPRNYSGTAPLMDMMNKYMPGTAMGMVSMLTGHNPITSLLVGGVTKFLGKDVPDAVRLAMLKFLGSNQPIEAEGFKTMVDFMNHAIKGEKLIKNATKSVFKSGQMVLPQSQLPDSKDLMKLDKQLKSVQANPESMFNIGGKTAHYMPEHGTAMAQTAMTAANYVNAQRPNLSKQSPLDTEPKMNAIQKAHMERTLTIAQQPLVVLEHIKQGTLLQQDVEAIQSMYPALYQKLNSQLSDAMINHLSEDEPIPYRTKMSLSMFMAQPLDSTMTPVGIQNSQMSFSTVSPMQEQQGKTNKVPENSFKKLSMNEQTPLQARSAQKLG